jgi:hypothetical protein
VSELSFDFLLLLASANSKLLKGRTVEITTIEISITANRRSLSFFSIACNTMENGCSGINTIRHSNRGQCDTHSPLYAEVYN